MGTDVHGPGTSKSWPPTFSTALLFHTIQISGATHPKAPCWAPTPIAGPRRTPCVPPSCPRVLRDTSATVETWHSFGGMQARSMSRLASLGAFMFSEP